MSVSLSGLQLTPTSQVSLSALARRISVRFGGAVIVAPEGGFLGLAIEDEGFRVARWLADHGIAEALEEQSAEEAALVQRLSAECADLANFVFEYVEHYAEVLRKHAPLLRLTMMRAEHDPLVAVPGKQYAFRAE